MLILFDHSTPAPLAAHLTEHSVTKAKDRGWDRLSNGDLLAAAVGCEFESRLPLQVLRTFSISAGDTSLLAPND
jgi:hypothetical protein